MADDISLELWLDRRKLDALDKALSDADYEKGIEKYMQEKLIELYIETVPDEVQVEINYQLDAERRIDERRPVSAFRIVENGNDEIFSVQHNYEFLDVAQKLRVYLGKGENSQTDFCDCFNHKIPIDDEEYDALISRRMENTGEVSGVFDIDFDKREFSAVHIMDGWKTFSVGDVSTAAYHAFRKYGLKEDKRWDIFLDKLDGKDITSAGHLTAHNISFAEEIIEMDERLNFYIETTFDVDEVFGTNVCTSENDDWLNVYANYDMLTGTVCDELAVELHRGDGSEEEQTYTLNAAEKEVLLRKMEDYCMEQTGMKLKDYCAECLAECSDGMQQPTM